MDYVSNTTVEAVAERLLGVTGGVVVLTHAKPDGDAAGSVSALVSALRAVGKAARGVLAGPVSQGLLGVPGVAALDRWDGSELGETALLVVVDTGAWSQLGEAGSWVRGREADTVVIDHHLSGDVAAGMLLVDAGGAAAAEVVAEVIGAVYAGAGRSEGMSSEQAGALFAGLASDTGWFRFSSVTPRTHRLAATLIEAGADPVGLYEHLEQAERVEKLALLTRAVSSLEVVAGGRAAVMTLTEADFEQTGAFEEETERLVNLPLQVGTIEAVVLAAESRGPDGLITRLSFRSKPGRTRIAAGATLDEGVNVAELAQRFGGGGHARAAGAKAEGSAAGVLPLVRTALEAVLR